MGITELFILWIIGALIFQQYIRGIKTVWWKEFTGILLWPLVSLYILVKMLMEMLSRKKGD